MTETPASPSVASPDEGTALCLACGLCCDGGLFAFVELNEDDRARLAANGLAAPERLPHPCPHFAAHACSIYPVRPYKCSDYECTVLADLNAGRIDAGAAHAVVGEARCLRAEVDAVLPAGTSITRLAEDLRLDVPDSRVPARLQALARFVAYRMFVERRFLGPSTRWLTRKRA